MKEHVGFGHWIFLPMCIVSRFLAVNCMQVCFLSDLGRLEYRHKVKFCTVFHNVLLLWSEPPALYRNPFLVCSGEPVFCLLYTFRAWINKLLRSPSPPPFMFPCLNVVDFLLTPTRPLVICGCETVHFE
jgi:hypothetical protein